MLFSLDVVADSVSSGPLLSVVLVNVVGGDVAAESLFALYFV